MKVPDFTNPRDYAMALVEEGIVDWKTMLSAAVKYMSHADVRDMLDFNEFSPEYLEK